MPTGQRIRGNNAFGTITDNPLTLGATTVNSAGLVNLPPVAFGSHAVITLDPLRQHGDPEIVIVTVHTISSTVATITRGAYGTVARAHPTGTAWAHAPITEDVTVITSAALRPTNPYEGQTIYENDTNRYALYDGVGWLPGGLVTVCTSGTRPTIPFEGQVIFETDTDRYSGYNGSAWETIQQLGAWTAFTPTVKFGATTASIQNDSRWIRSGRMITVSYAFRITNLNGGTGTLTITRPVVGRMSTDPVNSYTQTYGTSGVIDVSAGNLYHGFFSADLADGSDIVVRTGASPGVAYTHADHSPSLRG